MADFEPIIIAVAESKDAADKADGQKIFLTVDFSDGVSTIKPRISDAQADANKLPRGITQAFNSATPEAVKQFCRDQAAKYTANRDAKSITAIDIKPPAPSQDQIDRAAYQVVVATYQSFKAIRADDNIKSAVTDEMFTAAAKAVVDGFDPKYAGMFGRI